MAGRYRDEILVSILAPLARGALRIDSSVSVPYIEFQSSPPSQGGRYFDHAVSYIMDS